MALLVHATASAQDLNSAVNLPVPKGWRIDEVKRDATWRVLSVEKKGFTTSGSVTARWHEGVHELDSVLQQMANAFERRFVLRDAVWGSAHYKDWPARTLEFWVAPVVPFVMRLKAFHACGFTIVVVEYVAKEDLRARAAAMREIEAGFACRL